MAIGLAEGKRTVSLPARQLANQAFSRASGAPLRSGNHVRLLKDAAENYRIWLETIREAQQSVHVEMYFIRDDAIGQQFADALSAKASAGVAVRVLYDWMGGLGKTSRAFWRRLRASGVDVRCYNPPRFDQPFGWILRDHRKLIVVDGHVGFVPGLCIGQEWAGDPARSIEPWRDTGVELRGPAVADLEAAFAEAWAAAGDPLPPEVLDAPPPLPSGDVDVRVIATLPRSAELLRVDQLVAAMARETLWLTDAYYAGTVSYVQTLRAAAHDGVDVRLLVPSATDIPLLRPITRAGYRLLLEAGVRVFEWNGSMLHAKTAVADGRWARVGSTNLNLASWMTNRELDLVVENVGFAQQMQAMFEADLTNATEIVLERSHVRAQHRVPRPRRRAGGSGSAGRVVAGAVRISNTVGAAIANTRVLESAEASLALMAGTALVAIGAVALWEPRLIAWPLAAIALWIALVLTWRGLVLWRKRP